ncbi:hypothetical protein BHE74_00059062 [Ensete ventricosum]|nr:hypothetical protein BHE74_00059062 [Ensete ventricosum]
MHSVYDRDGSLLRYGSRFWLRDGTCRLGGCAPSQIGQAWLFPSEARIDLTYLSARSKKANGLGFVLKNPAQEPEEYEKKKMKGRAGGGGRAPGIGRVLAELALGGEDDEGDLGVAEDGDLVGLLEQPGSALGEGHLPIDLVLDPLQLHSPPPHLDRPPLPLLEH